MYNPFYKTYIAKIHSFELLLSPWQGDGLSPMFASSYPLNYVWTYRRNGWAWVECNLLNYHFFNLLCRLPSLECIHRIQLWDNG